MNTSCEKLNKDMLLTEGYAASKALLHISLSLSHFLTEMSCFMLLNYRFSTLALQIKGMESFVRERSFISKRSVTKPNPVLSASIYLSISLVSAATSLLPFCFDCS